MFRSKNLNASERIAYCVVVWDFVDQMGIKLCTDQETKCLNCLSMNAVTFFEVRGGFGAESKTCSSIRYCGRQCVTNKIRNRSLVGESSRFGKSKFSLAGGGNNAIEIRDSVEIVSRMRRD